MSRFATCVSRSLLVLIVLFVPVRARAQSAPATAADFFDSATLQEVRLFINSRDLQELRDRWTEDVYFPVDFVWRGIRVRNAAVRMRGLATRDVNKPNLRIDFNRYVAGQEFLGLNSVVLDNVLKDPAMIRERTSMAFIERMGQPASRESFGRLYINDVYQGVYAFVEPVDTDYLARTLGENAGYLFEHKWSSPNHGEYLGDELEAYKSRFEAQTHRMEPDSILLSPIRDLFREVNHDLDNVWRDRVSEYIDLSQLITYVAIEAFLSEDDGFLGYAGIANFYLYRPAGQNVHRVLPWDRDSTFHEIKASIFARTETNVLVQRALSFADLRDLYLEVLERCARSAAEDRWLENEVIRVSALIRGAVYEDSSKQFSNEVFEESIAYLVEFARQQPAHVIREVANARRATAR
jgi:spore coat protein CotH